MKLTNFLTVDTLEKLHEEKKQSKYKETTSPVITPIYPKRFSCTLFLRKYARK